MNAHAENDPADDFDFDEPISPVLRRRLQECYERSSALMQQETYDFDYVHTLLVECVSRDPSNFVYLDAFFENLHRKYKNNKRGAVLQFGGKGNFKKALAREDWDTVLAEGPRALKLNPWDVPTLRGMAEACSSRGYYEAELRYLRNALEVKPRDATVNRHCAMSLARVGRFDQAIACWQRVDEAKNGDQEAQDAVAELQIAKSEGRTSVLTGEAAPPVRRPDRKPRQDDDSPSERRQIPLTPRQQLEQALVHNPADLDTYFQLVDLHVAEGRLGDASVVLGKALAASGNDLRAQERLEDVEILRKKQQLTIAENRLEQETSDERQQLAAQLKEDLNRYELEVFDRRAQRYPEDLELSFQLGVRLKRAGNYREALKQLKQASAGTPRAAAGALEQGECWQRLKKYSEALEKYQESANLADRPAQEEIWRLSLYRSALLAAGLGNERAAEQWFAQLVEADPSYRDAASRLDKIREMRHKR